MRAVAPLHLISAGTEGFFVEDRQSMLHWYNPGGLTSLGLQALRRVCLPSTCVCRVL
jgi:hypothetical protein